MNNHGTQPKMSHCTRQWISTLGLVVSFFGALPSLANGPDLFGETTSEKDPMYDQAVEVVLKNRKASISLVQRHLKIGYNRAARLVEDMEKAGMVSAMSSNGQREILVPTRQE